MLTSQSDITECYSDAPSEGSDITSLHYFDNCNPVEAPASVWKKPEQLLRIHVENKDNW